MTLPAAMAGSSGLVSREPTVGFNRPALQAELQKAQTLRFPAGV